MNRERRLLERWKTEYDFRTFVTASLSLGVTLIFAFYNGFLGVYKASLWHGAICVYYILLVLLRGLIISAAKKISRRGQQEQARERVYLAGAILLLILNLSLVVPLSIMVVMEKPVNLTLVPAIAMAVYTTYKVVIASVNLRKMNAASDVLSRLLRTISFIDALVSILTLQNTLIMVFSAGRSTEMLVLTAISSGAVWLGILSVSVITIVKGVKQIGFCVPRKEER